VSIPNVVFVAARPVRYSRANEFTWTEHMKITIEHKHVRSTDAIDRMVERQLLALANDVRIDIARVRLERQWDQTPPYRAAIHLITPGPDVKAEGADQTLQAAVAKALRILQRKSRLRSERARLRVKTNLQSPAQRRRARIKK
jgi:ribosome-associated translation inhibitor RaiA